MFLWGSREPEKKFVERPSISWPELVFVRRLFVHVVVFDEFCKAFRFLWRTEPWVVVVCVGFVAWVFVVLDGYFWRRRHRLR